MNDPPAPTPCAQLIDRLSYSQCMLVLKTCLGGNLLKRHLFVALFLMVIFLSPLMSRKAYAQNSTLRELAKEDQDSRTGKSVTRTDEERIKIVLSLIGSGELKTPEDKRGSLHGSGIHRSLPEFH